MGRRWRPVAVLAAVLFGINVVARLVTRLVFDADDGLAQSRASIAMFAAIGVVLAGVAFVRSQRVPPAVWAPPLAAATGIAMLLTVLVGPLVSGDNPVGSGAASVLAQFGVYAGFAVAGTLLGYWAALAAGRDHRSRRLAALAQARAGRPRRVVRR